MIGEYEGKEGVRDERGGAGGRGALRAAPSPASTKKKGARNCKYMHAYYCYSLILLSMTVTEATN